MMLGHAMLAGVLVAVIARVLGRDRRFALLLGGIGAVFAVLPDVDMVYALNGLFATSGGVWGVVDAFWAASTVTHRGLSHSLVFLGLIGFACCISYRWPRPGVAGGLFAGITGAAYMAGGALAGVTIALFVVGAFAVTYWVRRHTDVSLQWFAGTVAVALFSHPFGDVFTGVPPVFFAPFNIGFLTERVVLHPDATLNLLAILGIEIGLAWAGLTTVIVLTGRSIATFIRPVGATGLLYSVVVFLLQPPTLQSSYQLVFTLIGFGIIVGALWALETYTDTVWAGVRRFPVLFSSPRSISPDSVLGFVVIGVSVISAGFIAYTAAYITFLT